MSDPNASTATDLPAVDRDALLAAGWPALLVEATGREGRFVAHLLHLGFVRFVKAAPTSAGWVFLGRPEVTGEEWSGRTGCVLEVRLEDVRSVTEIEED